MKRWSLLFRSNDVYRCEVLAETEEEAKAKFMRDPERCVRTSEFYRPGTLHEFVRVEETNRPAPSGGKKK